MDLGLADKVALVVGGDGLLGSAITHRLRLEGAVVVTASRSQGDLRLDATDAASAADAVAEVQRRHGRLDVVVVTAAPSAGSFPASAASDPDAVLDAIAGKAMTFLRVAIAAVPALRAQGGRLIGISGQNAWVTGSILAGERNAALNLAAKNLADELAGSGVTVNVVNPGGVVDEPATEVPVGSGGQTTPTEVAALVAFLASDLASTISGESIAAGHRLRGVALP